jgi:PAS domain-containing protein
VCASISEGLLVHENTRVLLCNQAFQHMFGCTSDPCRSMRERHVTEFVDPACHSLFIETILKHHTAGVVRYAVMGRREDTGALFEVQVEGMRLDGFTALLFRTPSSHSDPSTLSSALVGMCVCLCSCVVV